MIAFERERERADRLTVELLQATAETMAANEATARLEGGGSAGRWPSWPLDRQPRTNCKPTGTSSLRLSPPLSHLTYPSSWSGGPIVPRPREDHRRRFVADVPRAVSPPANKAGRFPSFPKTISSTRRQ